jgi:peptidoglycan/LPS O-acetylase OafA/YrhL
MTTASNRIHYLDSMRGLAAMTVVWSHFCLAYGLPRGAEWILSYTPLHILWDGAAAVSLFFVLSGLVLSLKYFPDLQSQSLKPPRFNSYLITRITRIWLPYAFIAIISYLSKCFLFKHYSTIPNQSEWIQSFWQTENSLKHLLLELNLFTVQTIHQLLPHGWTLFIEMTISLFVPAAAWFAGAQSFQLIFLGIISVFALNTPIFVLHFMLGMLIAQHYRYGQRNWTELSHHWKWTLFIAGVTLYTSRFTIPTYLNSPASLYASEYFISCLTGLGAAVLIFLAMASRKIQKTLSYPPLLYLGKISYSVYLCHFLILLCFTPFCLNKLNAIGLTHWLTSWSVGLLLTSVATVALSGLLYNWIEDPCMKLGKRFAS